MFKKSYVKCKCHIDDEFSPTRKIFTVRVHAFNKAWGQFTKNALCLLSALIFVPDSLKEIYKCMLTQFTQSNI